MILKNLMEDKQLDFNQPLLSVRRFSSMVATSESEEKKGSDNLLAKVPPLPVYKSELKSGPVRNAGTVPFKWERSPGQPKDESKLQTGILERLTTVPKLPPGRVLNVKHHSSENGVDGKIVTPSQTGAMSSIFQNVSCSDKNVKEYESSNGEIEETGISGSEDNDEAYVDALDSLSRANSFFLNCSVSGVSGLDGPDIRPSGIFSADPQTRDFMMGRFLPAAKAMASETPAYATRKPPLVQEQPRHIKKAVCQDKQRPVCQFSSNNFQPQSSDTESGVSEEKDDYNGLEDPSTKVCGLLPHFLLKSTLCLFNPVMGMKIQTQKPVSVRRVHVKSSYLVTSTETDYEHSKASAYEKGTTVLFQKEEHQVVKNELNELNSKSSKISCRGDCQKPDGSSLYRCLQGNVASAYSRGCSYSMHQEKGFLGIHEKSRNCRANEFEAHEKESNSFGELLMASEGSKSQSVSASPAIEKTLYIDSLHKVKSPDSSSADAIKLNDSKSDDFAILKSREMKETPSVDSSDQFIMDLNLTVEKAVLLGNNVESARNMQMDAGNGYRRDHELIQDYSKSTYPKVTKNEKVDLKRQLLIGLSDKASSHELFLDGTLCRSSKEADHIKIASESHCRWKSSNQETYNNSCSQLPLALALPKSPSDSWLRRALPAVSLRSSSSHSSPGSHNYSRNQAAKSLTADPKWVNTVRTSNGQQGHLQCSEELLTPIPEE
ncbi:hypothetical protein SLA2020_232990 [Shorea laevis]